jgi:hypothetical protein
VVRPPDGSGVALLADVRLAGHPGYDRFVLEFEGPLPGYRVGYTPRPVIADPSGAVVAVEGTLVLSIRLEPASGVDLLGATARPTYDGPRRLRADTASVREAVLVGDFESVLTWVLGVDGRQPFVVSALSSPPRIVVDVSTG